jgi:hypothetical protein
LYEYSIHRVLNTEREKRAKGLARKKREREREREVRENATDWLTDCSTFTY